jgi:RNA polymerase sigma factor (sigma-70 family)
VPAQYQAWEPPESDDAPVHHDLTAADLVAARRREPAAVTRIYTAYAPALSRYFLAAVGDHRLAEDLTGTAFVSAIEALPRFRGPIEALGGWLFRIARHDLYDHRRRQARPRIEPLEDNLDETAVAAGAREALGNESDTDLDGGGVAPQPMPPKLSRRLRNDMDDETIDAPLNRLSSREREILAMLANGWSNRRIAEACYLSLNTVRTHVENIQVKLGVHTKLEAVAVARARLAAGCRRLRGARHRPTWGQPRDGRHARAPLRPARGATAAHGRRADRPRSGRAPGRDHRRGQGTPVPRPGQPGQGPGPPEHGPDVRASLGRSRPRPPAATGETPRVKSIQAARHLLDSVLDARVPRS